MAKRPKQKKANHDILAKTPDSKATCSCAWIVLLLAVITFWVYWPSLRSDFVYDARREILEEGFVTSFSNLPSVLSLKVLGTNWMLKDRPGQILYLMFNAAIWGKEPFGYHLSSVLLQVANVVLLFGLLRRLIIVEAIDCVGSASGKIQLALAAVTLLFALHPIAVESVAEVSYCATLLVTFFTLLALLMATYFQPQNLRIALLTGGIGVLCAFAAVISKESGIAVAALLIVYWFLYRRQEAKAPWFWFLGAAMAVTAAFLAALFILTAPNRAHLGFLGGSFSQVFLIQPRLWVFMMGKLLWPMQLSADYTVEEIGSPTLPFALVVLLVVILLQVWLICKSRMGALGVAIYWLGLVTVSNFVPLNRPLADRFYHLPLAGVAMQLLALLLMIVKSPRGFWVTMVILFGAILPLTFLTWEREKVFANELALWSDTVRVSPLSSLAHHNLGRVFFEQGRTDEAMVEYQKALAISPDDAKAHYNLGVLLVEKGRVDEGVAEYQKALAISPNLVEVYNNLGFIFLEKGHLDEAMAQYRKASEINPNVAEVHNGLGAVLFQKGEIAEAMAQFQEALRLKPDYIEAQNNLAKLQTLRQQ